VALPPMVPTRDLLGVRPARLRARRARGRPQQRVQLAQPGVEGLAAAARVANLAVAEPVTCLLLRIRDRVGIQ
jgi:hypothetical protein